MTVWLSFCEELGENSAMLQLAQQLLYMPISSAYIFKYIFSMVFCNKSFSHYF